MSKRAGDDSDADKIQVSLSSAPLQSMLLTWTCQHVVVSQTVLAILADGFDDLATYRHGARPRALWSGGEAPSEDNEHSPVSVGLGEVPAILQ